MFGLDILSSVLWKMCFLIVFLYSVIFKSINKKQL